MNTLMKSTSFKSWKALLPISWMIVLVAPYSLMADDTNQPTVGFVRYSNVIDNSNGSRTAIFAITNTTEQWLDSSPGRAQIEVKTTNGWTDFSSKSPDPFLVLSGWAGAEPHKVWRIYRHVPQNQGLWRLHVHYTIRGGKDYDVYSQEMPNEPAR